MEPATPIVVFVRKLEATFGERALSVAEAQLDEAVDGARIEWERVVDMLKLNKGTRTEGG